MKPFLGTFPEIYPKMAVLFETGFSLKHSFLGGVSGNAPQIATARLSIYRLIVFIAKVHVTVNSEINHFNRNSCLAVPLNQNFI